MAPRKSLAGITFHFRRVKILLHRYPEKVTDLREENRTEVSVFIPLATHRLCQLLDTQDASHERVVAGSSLYAYAVKQFSKT
jgi:hypothetical protein